MPFFYYTSYMLYFAHSPLETALDAGKKLIPARAFYEITLIS